MDIKQTILERYGAADQYLKQKRIAWSQYEDLFHGVVRDPISIQTGNVAFDPKLSSALLEREARVMAQLPTGKVKAVSRNDEMAARLMNLTLDKYVLPNANAQFDFLTKCRMVDRYSNLYGSYFVMVDWDVRDNGYKGPDMWLIPIRDVFPQVGALSLKDSDYVTIRSWRPISFFEGLAKRQGFKNVGKIIATLKDKSSSKEARDADQKSQREQQQYPDMSSPKKSGYYEVLSHYEKDRWVDFVPDADEILRDSHNPHDNGELPVVAKYSIPLVDDFMAMGDMERGAPMQNILNSVWNLYLNAVKVSIYPPTLINKDSVADPDSIKFSAAAKWLVRGNIGNAVQPLNVSPQGTSTFNNVYQVVTASILNMFGTTQTNTTSQTDPGFGKTPQALEMQASRENAKDSVDRFYMEQFLTEVNKKFVNLISKQKSGGIQFRMFEDEIDELVQTFPEMEEMYDKKTGKITLDKKKTGSIVYDYEMVSGSTYALDQKQQQQNIMALLTAVLNPQTYQMLQGELQKENKQISLAELFTRSVSNSGIQDWDKIIVDMNKNPQMILDQHKQQFEQALQQAMARGSQPTSQMPAQVPQDASQMIPQGQPNEISNQTQPL